MRRGWVIPTALLTVATVAFPCGGSLSYNVDGPLIPAATFAERALYPVYDMLENMTRDEIQFLRGLVTSDSARFEGLIGRPPLQVAWWDTVAKPRVAEPSAGALQAAWNRGDVDGAVRAARQVVSGVMALPFAEDSARDAALRLAVETIELAPMVASQPAASRRSAFTTLAQPLRGVPFDSLPVFLARTPTSPRRASLEYAALRGAVRTGIPDDNRDALQTLVPAARWDSLQTAHREWLRRNPAHPYAGLVQLGRVRLFFLASQSDSTWRTLLSLYPEYPVRAASEMRYLLKAGMLPPASFIDDGRVPLELRAALIGNTSPSPATWNGLMQTARSRPASRAMENLEERLLAVLVSDSTTTRFTLPSAFPAWRATASPLWRYLWAASLLRAGRADDALPYTRTPITVRDDTTLSGDAAMLAARIHLARRDWSAAAATPGLDEWTRRYVVRVLAPDSAVAAIRAVPERAVAREARLVLATRAAQAGRWSEAAATVRDIDAPRAALYTRLGTLARDTASNAGLARFAAALSGASGRLFYESSRYYYRGMMNRDYTLYPRWSGDSARVWDLPWTKEAERAQMFRSLREGSERFLALQMYASYFARTGLTAAERRAAVQAADRAYRALLQTDPSRSDSGYWADSLPVSPVARAIRAAGRR